MRVLVADDDRQMSLLICQMLMAAGHQAYPAYDGASTMMAAVRQPSPDLIILNLQKPIDPDTLVDAVEAFGRGK